ncbi:hypothetical protein KL912_004100 [Ogataea haglerorum]|nr:hypothetical protein KL912_004100 [Ogataea haglerorum]
MSKANFDNSEEERKSVANLESVQIVPQDSVSELFEVDDTHLKRTLKSRHIGMIALVSVFGTGLFLSSGGTLAKTGPVGILIAYALIGTIVGLNQIAFAEVAALAPLTGSTIRHSEIFIDEAVGFAYGYLSLWQNLLPGGLVSAALIIQYWSNLSPAVWISVLAVPIAITNLFSVRIYGEVEFVFALLKICLIAILVLAGLVLDLGGVKGQERLGFHYWKDPGPFAEFGIALLAGETQNPRTNIPRAAKRILYRVVSLYMVAVFILSLIVPYNDKKIAVSDGTAAHSPYVVAFERGGIKVLPHVVNALTLTSAWSEANAGIASSARVLFSLAAKKQAPRRFLKTTKTLNVPFVGVALALLFLALSYMSVNSTAATVFSWFQNITSSNLLVGWILISICHIRMNRALKAQGYKRSDLPYHNRLAPAGAWISLIASIILLLTGGFTTFIHGNWQTSTFVSAYCSPMLFVLFCLAYKIIKRTPLIDLKDIIIPALMEDYKTRPENDIPPRGIYKFLSLLWS